MSANKTIRVLDPAEVAVAIEWAAEEGWNPGIGDAIPFRRVDPKGFLGLFVDGAMAACISAVSYDPGFGFVGFYICRSDLRGRGHGKALWDAALARLKTRTVGLDGVVAQQANYAAGGFVLAHRNIRYSGRVTGTDKAPASLVPIGDDAPEALIDLIVAYDRPLFPGQRDEFIRQWIDGGGRRSFAFIENRQMRGYGTIRSCRRGFKVAPLFADDDAVATALLGALLGPLADEEVILDVPQPNVTACLLAEHLGLAPTFETARMYKGPVPALPLERIYGLTSFELG